MIYHDSPRTRKRLVFSLKRDSYRVMIRGGFLSASERADLKTVISHPSEIHGVARRATAILLLDDGLSCAEVARVLYLDDDTVRTWHKHYRSGGLDELTRFDWHGRQGYLSEAQERALSAHLSRRVHRDTGEVRAHILATHGIAYSHSGCIKLMRRLGFEYRRPKGLPAQADEAKQRAFIKDYETLLRGLADDETVYFADAVHPEYQSRPTHGCVRREENVALRRTSGRKRVNLHGALDLESFDCPLVEADRINAVSTIALLDAIEARNPNKRRIHVILDNARYHHARLVKQWLARPQCRIELHFLPAYAPHLNAIERLWGVMHREVTHNKFYPTFAQFTEAIDGFFAEMLPEKWRAWRDTVTDNFRVISHQGFRVLE